MKRSKKTFKSSLFSGHKGKFVIQKTKLSLRKALASNVVAARAALKGRTCQTSPISAVTPPSVTSASSVFTYGTQSTSGMSSLTQESTKNKKRGVTFNEFVEGNGLDWRKFGWKTFNGMKSSGYYNLLMKRINDYFRARTSKAKHMLVVSSSELPLSDNSSTHLHSKMIVVNSMLLKVNEDPSGSIVDMSSAIEKIVVIESAELIRRWTLQFIHNGGTFKNHSYKKRPPIGIISDPSIREAMTKWMINATRAKPPAVANDFKDFVNAEYQTNIQERTAQIWLRLLGFKYRTSEALEIYNDGHQRQDVKHATQQY